MVKGWPDFRKHLDLVRFVERPEIERMYAECGHDGDNWVKAEVSDRFHAKYPHFSRDHGAKILEIVSTATGEVLTRNEIEFCGDSLMCEWAYVIDLDKGTFEVFKGFNKKSLEDDERFSKLPTRDHVFKDGDGPEYTYKQVKLEAEFKLADLPSDANFLARLKKDEEE